MKRFSFMVAAMLATTPVVHAAGLSGRARVVDGDTIKIHGQSIRIHGIDAPEGGQTCRDKRGQRYDCGVMATRAMRGLIGKNRVTCEAKDRDQYGRVVALCRANGIDLGAGMVRQGHALAFRRYSSDYVMQEAAARGARRGLWAGKFQLPWDWRKARREKIQARSVAQSPPRPGCPIKGNINRKGAHIFHRPGDRDYARTRIDRAKGERWFCSPGEAIAAGWRAPRGG